MDQLLLCSCMIGWLYLNQFMKSERMDLNPFRTVNYTAKAVTDSEYDHAIIRLSVILLPRSSTSVQKIFLQ